AHDAGLDGTLIQNTTKATFTMESLEAGERYRIGGTQYTIGAQTNEEVAKALKFSAGMYDKSKANTVEDGWNLTAGDTISIDGKTYTIISGNASDVANAKVTNGYLHNLIVEGSTLKYNGNEVTRFAKLDHTTGIDKSNATLITATAAYNMVAIELKAASSVGATDGAADVDKFKETDASKPGVKAGNYAWKTTEIEQTVGGETQKTTTISFSIDKGHVNVQNALTLNLHVGADAAMSNKINVAIEAMNSKSIGINGINVSDATGKAATYAIDAIADAIQRVSAQRAELGAIQNRLEHSIKNLDNVVENTEAAESRIRDTDMADQMVEYSKNNILQQAGQSMLAQANQATQGVMNLLQ
ncbi:flagellin, partial [Pseudobutyrivibrio sp.]|uniref:flagellin n=1 Tax=Pseudobutyrivibrio sp. TaxID=2014367 RepID=UPI001B65FCF3